MRAQAEILSAPLPPLLAQADNLANTVLWGDHGRRRAGIGDTFWQFRAAQQGDDARMIDWRRSARSNTQFVQDKEWQIAQTVQLWVDRGASMQFASSKDTHTKIERAKLLTLALSILLLRAGERVGLTGLDLPARGGIGQINHMADVLAKSVDADYATPDHGGLVSHSRAVFMSDCLGNFDEISKALTKAADRGVKGMLLQILDPAEEQFPFSGRTRFQSMGGSIEHETLHAGELKDRYIDRLAARRDQLETLTRATGWQFSSHHTGNPAIASLLWLYSGLENANQ